MITAHFIIADAIVSPDPFFSLGVLLIGIPMLIGLVGAVVVGLILLIKRPFKKNSAQTDYRGIPYGTPPEDPQDRNTDQRS